MLQMDDDKQQLANVIRKSRQESRAKRAREEVVCDLTGDDVQWHVKKKRQAMDIDEMDTDGGVEAGGGGVEAGEHIEFLAHALVVEAFRRHMHV